VSKLCHGLGAEDEDLVPFEKYAKAAEGHARRRAPREKPVRRRRPLTPRAPARTPQKLRRNGGVLHATPV
jgi:hypothetical protein